MPPGSLAPPPVSLLLRPRFPPPGVGGARPPGTFIPGMGGAPAMGGGPEFVLPLLSMMGADRSLTATFFKRAVAGPLDMSDSKAPCNQISKQIQGHCLKRAVCEVV